MQVINYRHRFVLGRPGLVWDRSGLVWCSNFSRPSLNQRGQVLPPVFKNSKGSVSRQQIYSAQGQVKLVNEF